MNFETVLAVVIVLTLFGLTRTTELILEIRQKQRDRGKNQKIYL